MTKALLKLHKNAATRIKSDPRERTFDLCTHSAKLILQWQVSGNPVVRSNNKIHSGILWSICVEQTRHPWKVTQNISKLFEDLEDFVLTNSFGQFGKPKSKSPVRTSAPERVPRCQTRTAFEPGQDTPFTAIGNTLETHWKYVVRLTVHHFFQVIGVENDEYTKRKIGLNQKYYCFT